MTPNHITSNAIKNIERGTVGWVVFNPILAEHLELRINTHLESHTRGRVSAQNRMSEQHQVHRSRSMFVEMQLKVIMSESRSESLISQSQRFLRATAQVQRTAAAPAAESCLSTGVPSAMPWLLLLRDSCAQLCRDSWRALPLVRNNGHGKLSNPLQNLILPLVSFSHFTENHLLLNKSPISNVFFQHIAQIGTAVTVSDYSAPLV